MKREKMGFTADTYICLDVPMPVAQQIMDIRLRSHDTFRAALPVEITLTGSSGIGVFDARQDEKMAFALLDAIAAETEPLPVTFGKVLRFPSTDIFVLTLTDERPFRMLHERIVSSGIRFQPSPFPYTPHCTLRSRSPVSEEETADLLSLCISQSFLLDTLSVYMLETLPMTLLHEVKLTGEAKKKDLSECQ
jgi:2'-5' RNA ligase